MEPTIPVLTLTDQDFPTNGRDHKKSPSIDKLLQKCWSDAETRGALAYSFDRNSLREKKLPGRWGLWLHLNTHRGGKLKRPAQSLSSFTQRLTNSVDQFNFNKVPVKEKLFEIKILGLDDGRRDESREDDADKPKSLSALVLVNRCPFESYSSLLVPECHRLESQLIRPHSLLAALAVIIFSDNPTIRLGFNSLGAGASVNHGHWHVAYFQHSTPLSWLPVDGRHLLQTWIARTIVLPLDATGQTLNDCLHMSQRLCQWLDWVVDELKLAYNVIILREELAGEMLSRPIRLCVWIRKPDFGTKQNFDIVAAICELCGFFICKSDLEFNELNETDCLNKMAEKDIDQSTFDQILQKFNQTLF